MKKKFGNISIYFLYVISFLTFILSFIPFLFLFIAPASILFSFFGFLIFRSRYAQEGDSPEKLNFSTFRRIVLKKESGEAIFKDNLSSYLILSVRRFRRAFFLNALLYLIFSLHSWSCYIFPFKMELKPYRELFQQIGRDLEENRKD